MPWSLSSNSIAKPEERLRQAISSFEASLQPKQKTEYDAEKRQMGSSAPTARDVMKFAYHIDQQAVSQKRGLSCIGPRFNKVLHAVQQFASIGDILVGGSQNLIACSAWTVVRTSILALSKNVAALDRLSTLFMIVGRSLPRTEQLATLYPRSKELRANACEFLIIVVDLCKLLAKVSEKSAIGLLSSPMKDMDLQKYQSDLEDLNQIMRDEVQLLMAQNIERIASLTETMSRTTSRVQKLKAQSAVLDMCSTYKHEAEWKRLRKAGVSSIHRKCDSYHLWHHWGGPTLLVIKGKLGSGKSVLMASIVAELNAELPATALVCFFFIDHWTASSMDTQVILRSILRQILQELDDDASIAEIVQLRKRWPSTNDFRALAMRLITGKRHLYLLVDGIDALSVAHSKAFVAELLEMQRALNEQSVNMKLCLSVRTEAKSEVLNFLPPASLSMDISVLENDDLQNFITQELERRLDRNELNIGDPSLILEIHETLSRGADGMFLWAVLQIESLCVQRTDAKIRQALLDLPKTLEETFARVLHRSSTSQDQIYQEQTMQIIAAARRPLTLDEFREAISVEKNVTVWSPSRLVNEVNDVLATCGSLIAIDEEDQTIHFVHHTVYTYFLSRLQNTTELSPKPMLDRHMADIVTTYLAYDIFTKQLTRTEPKKELVLTTNMTGTAVIESSLSPGVAKSIALRLLKHKKHGTVDISRTMANLLGAPSNKSAQSTFHFHKYASEYAHAHSWVYLETTETLPQFLVDRILAILPQPTGLPLGWLEDPNPKALLYYTFLGLSLTGLSRPLKVARLLVVDCDGTPQPIRLSSEAHPMLMLKDGQDNSGLDWAVCNNKLEILCRILDRTSITKSINNKTSLRTALKLALVWENWACAAAIVDAGFPVDWLGNQQSSLLAELRGPSNREHTWYERQQAWLVERGATSLERPYHGILSTTNIADLLLLKDYESARKELLSGADIDGVSALNNPLTVCLERKAYKSVAWLIQNGADTKVTNMHGCTVLETVLRQQAYEDIKALIHAGIEREPYVDQVIMTLAHQTNPSGPEKMVLRSLSEWDDLERIPWQDFYLSKEEIEAEQRHKAEEKEREVAQRQKEMEYRMNTRTPPRRYSDAHSLDDEWQAMDYRG